MFLAEKALQAAICRVSALKQSLNFTYCTICNFYYQKKKLTTDIRILVKKALVYFKRFINKCNTLLALNIIENNFDFIF